MTQPADVYSVYDASGTTGVGKGNREDLVNAVYDISPTDTPFLTLAPRGTADAVLHEWTTHALRAAAANEKVEGDDATITAATPKVRLNNRTAITGEVAGVTKTQQRVKKVGMQDALAEEVMYKTSECKRDMEVMLFANTAKVAGDDTTARKTAGLPTWLKDNVSRGTNGTNPTGDGSDTAGNGTQRAFAESDFLTVSQSCWANGGNPTWCFVSGRSKRTATGFAGNQNRNMDAGDKRITNSITFYEDDFNTIKFVAERVATLRDAFLVDPEMVELSYLRPWDEWDLAITGSSMRKQIETEWCLSVLNPAAHGTVADLL